MQSKPTPKSTQPPRRYLMRWIEDGRWVEVVVCRDHSELVGRKVPHAYGVVHLDQHARCQYC